MDCGEGNSQTRCLQGDHDIVAEIGSGRDLMDAVGIDFGTTNSSVALVREGEPVRLASFPVGTESPSFRSVLYLEQLKSTHGARRIHSLTGPEAIQRYLEAEEKGRLIQSLKSHLSSRSLTGTEIFGRRHRLEDLVSRILKDLRKSAEEQFGIPIRSATVGRPVRFVGAASSDDDDFALGRLARGIHARWIRAS